MTYQSFCTRINALLCVALVFVVSGCVEQTTSTAADAGIHLDLAVEPDPPNVSTATLMITVTDADGTPINDASLKIEGNMNHAGMVPVLRDVEGGAEDGVYHVPFEWSMAGDWIITVVATLADNTQVEESFELTVSTEGSGEMASMEHQSSDNDGDNDDDHARDENAQDENADEDSAGHDHDTEDDDEAAAMEHDMEMESELSSALEKLDVTGLHELDEAINENDAIEEEYLATATHFQEMVNMVPWPEEYSEDVASLHEAIAELIDALESGDMDVAKTSATVAHDIAHELKESLSEHIEESSHSHD